MQGQHLYGGFAVQAFCRRVGARGTKVDRKVQAAEPARGAFCGEPVEAKGEGVSQGSKREVAAAGVDARLAIAAGCAASSVASCLAACLLVGAASAEAQAVRQQQPLQTPVPGTRFDPPAGAVVNDPNRVFGDDGPAFAPLAVVGALGLRPSAGLTVTYDTNFARRPDGAQSGGRFNSRSDFIFRPSAGLAAERNVGRQRLFASVGVGRAIHARNTRFNNNRFNAAGGLGFVLGNRCGGQVQAGYNKRDMLLGGFETAADATAENTTFGGTVNCSTASGITGSVGYNQGSQRNRSDDPSFDRSFADADFKSANGSLGYRVGQRGQVGVSAAWSDNRFPNQLVLGQENQVEIKTLSFFGTYRIGTLLNVNGSVGRTSVSSAVPGAQDFSGGVWNLGVGYTGPRIGANLSTSRSVNGGGNQAANLSVASDFTASATYRANDSLRFSAGYNRSNLDFESTQLIPNANVVNKFKTNRLFMGADYRLGRLLNMSADINYQRRTSDPDRFSFSATTFVLGVNTRF